MRETEGASNSFPIKNSLKEPKIWEIVSFEPKKGETEKESKELVRGRTTRISKKIQISFFLIFSF